LFNNNNINNNFYAFLKRVVVFSFLAGFEAFKLNVENMELHFSIFPQTKPKQQEE